MKTYYSLLNISKGASNDEVKSAYRSLASRYHPDINSDADSAEIFKLLNRAYKVLSDPDKRRDYDNLIAGGKIYRTHTEEEVVESSGAFSAYSNTLANILFFAFLALALTYFCQWLTETLDIFWNTTTIESTVAGGLFGFLLGFNGNFNVKEIFSKNMVIFRIIFWLILLASFGFLFYTNFQVLKSLF